MIRLGLCNHTQSHSQQLCQRRFKRRAGSVRAVRGRELWAYPQRNQTATPAVDLVEGAVWRVVDEDTNAGIVCVHVPACMRIIEDPSLSLSDDVCVLCN